MEWSLVLSSPPIVAAALLAYWVVVTIVLVTDVLFKPATTAFAGGLVALAFAVLWYALPLRRRSRGPNTCSRAATHLRRPSSRTAPGSCVRRSRRRRRTLAGDAVSVRW